MLTFENHRNFRVEGLANLLSVRINVRQVKRRRNKKIISESIYNLIKKRTMNDFCLVNSRIDFFDINIFAFRFRR